MVSYHHGYRLAAGSGLSWAGFAALLEAFADAAKAEAEIRIAGRLARSMVEAFDDDPDLSSKQACDRTMQEFVKKHVENVVAKKVDPDDFECEISIMAGSTGEAFALLHASQAFYGQIFAGVQGVEAWPWYDAEEPPEGTSKAEWSARRETWDAVLKRNGWRSALSFELFGPAIPLPSREIILQRLPSDEDRAHRLAINRSFVEFAQAKSATSMHEIHAAFWDHKQWLETEDGAEQLAARTTNARESLRPFRLET